MGDIAWIFAQLKDKTHDCFVTIDRSMYLNVKADLVTICKQENHDSPVCSTT